jgi:NADPH-dependent curcumin reductase
MVARVNRQILLKSRPQGAPSLDNFILKQGSVPEPGDGEVLMRTRWLSLDPYMRGRMSAAKSYAKPVEVGATMVGGTVGEVVASRNPNFALGDIAVGNGGWQDYAVANGSSLRKLNPAAAPVSTALGVLGMPGMTAYAGLANAPAAGRPQTADPAGGEGGFRLGGNSGRGRMTGATLASDAGCPRGVTCGNGVISQAIGALLGLGT